MLQGIDAGKVDLASSRLSGTCSLESTRRFRPIIHEDFDAHYARFESGLVILGVDLEGDLRLDSTTFGGRLDIRPSGNCRPRVKGEINLSDLRGRPWVQIEALDHADGIMILSGEMGELRLRPGVVEDEILPCRTARLLMRNAQIHGGLSLRLLQVDGTRNDNDRHGIAIENCEITGDVDFWHPTQFEGLANTNPLPAWKYGAAVIGPVFIKNTTIGGECDLSFLKASGGIEISDGTIRGDLKFSSTISPSLAGRNAPVGECQQFPQRAYADQLSLRMLTVENDIDLTGLTLFASDSQPTSSSPADGGMPRRFVSDGVRRYRGASMG